jgi:hypothetical protein
MALESCCYYEFHSPPACDQVLSWSEYARSKNTTQATCAHNKPNSGETRCAQKVMGCPTKAIAGPLTANFRRPSAVPSGILRRLRRACCRRKSPRPLTSYISLNRTGRPLSRPRPPPFLIPARRFLYPPPPTTGARKGPAFLGFRCPLLAMLPPAPAAPGW